MDINYLRKLIPGCSNYSIEMTGKVYNEKTGKIIKPYTHNRSVRVKITNDSGIRIYKNVARLVADNFMINDDPENDVIGHYDGNIENNDIGNLFYTNRKDLLNLNHTRNNIENRVRSTDCPVRLYNLITEELVEFPTIKKAALFLDCSVSTIYNVLSGKQMSFNSWMIERIK